MARIADDSAAEGAIQPVPLGDALSERYLAYALSTITARSLPDVRDGLKPVQRRLLYAMRALKLDPDAGFKKCARVVGDVIGKYHPHGDTAVYDALVRLAQTFAARYALVEGQGNFGNVDGDNAAAMRYTEARLTEVAQALLDGLDEDAVDFRETYDGGDAEPVVLPAAFPNLLANGAAGIAVGLATSIPPHNAGELCDALTALLKDSRLSDDALVELVPGPDFPTGGVLVEDRAQIADAYATGRGGFRVRARWEKEDLGPRPVPDRGHRDPLPGAEGAAGGAHRRAAAGAQARAAGGRAGRIGRGRAPRAGAQEPHGRGRVADGDAVPPDRAGDPHRAQHERAGCRRRPPRDDAEAGAPGVSRPSARRCCCGGRRIGWRRSPTGSTCWAAISSPTSTSTR